MPGVAVLKRKAGAKIYRRCQLKWLCNGLGRAGVDEIFVKRHDEVVLAPFEERVLGKLNQPLLLTFCLEIYFADIIQSIRNYAQVL